LQIRNIVHSKATSYVKIIIGLKERRRLIS
jgi:hypothetical protein